jgi:hypothetical protein
MSRRVACLNVIKETRTGVLVHPRAVKPCEKISEIAWIIATKGLRQMCWYFNLGLSKYEEGVLPVLLIRRKNTLLTLKLRNIKCVLASTFMSDYSISCPPHEKPSPHGLSSRYNLVLGNIHLRYPRENCNLQGAFVLPNFYAPYS